MVKKIIFVFLAGLLILNIMSSVYGITGAIGNARMVLRAKTGDKIEKSILVRNVNDIAVDISLKASGDLEDYIEIKDKEFRLNSGEEKKAYFTINVKKEGTTESKIDVKFTPVDGSNGVGLSSTIIVIAEKSNGSGDSEETQENNENSKIIGAVIGEGANKDKKVLTIALLFTTIIVLVFFFLLFFYSRKQKEEELNLKKSVKKREKKNSL